MRLAHFVTVTWLLLSSLSLFSCTGWCPGVTDEVLCWPAAAPGDTITQLCPRMQGVDPTSKCSTLPLNHVGVQKCDNVSLGVANPCLGVANPCLGVANPCLGVANPCLGVANPCLSVANPCLGVANPCLGVANPCLGVANPCLGVANPCRFEKNTWMMKFAVWRKAGRGREKSGPRRGETPIYRSSLITRVLEDDVHVQYLNTLI